MPAKKPQISAPKLNLVFVCTGNTCRSPMAEYIFKDYLRLKKSYTKFTVSSAGIYANDGAAMTAAAVSACRALGVKTDGKHKSRLLTIDILQNADVIVCMTESHRAALASSNAFLYGGGDGKKRIIGTAGELIDKEIDDPYGGTPEQYYATAKKIAEMCEPLYAAAMKYRSSQIRFAEN